MSQYHKEMVTEGFVASGTPWGTTAMFIYPNTAPFYRTFKKAKAEAGANGKVYKVTVTYEEVTD